ncbi:hypothetical protein FQN49_004569, partial [Arthroderma sp. PD_2]
RRGNPSEEIAPSASVYEYIVFRGSDVKDINFADEEKENKAPEQPQVPNDPAILGTTAPPRQAPGPAQAGRGQPTQFQQPPQQQQPPPGYPQQPPPYPNYYNPYGQQFRGPPGGPPGFPGAPGPGPGFPNMPYGQQGWYPPPPGQGFPQQPGPFGPPQMPIAPPRGPPGQQQQPPQQQAQSQQQRGADGAPASQNAPMPTSELPGGEKAPKKPTTPAPGPTTEKSDQKPAQTKPEPSTQANQAQKSQPAKPPAQSAPEPAPAPKNDRIIPAIPIALPLKPSAPATQAPAPAGQPATRTAPNAMEEATRAATAAVAAAMAKLPQPAGSQQQQQPTNGSVDSVAKRVGEMRPFDGERHSRGHHAPRARGGHRGHHQQQQVKKIEVPTTDYDFASANAKFNKQDLVKEAIASGSPLLEAEGNPASTTSETNGADAGDASSAASGHASAIGVYDKTSSFFDNLSSEMRDREEHTRTKTSGREWRGEEEKKNMETFGQGSVDSGYRGRGRGRGRGFGGRGRGYSRGYGGGRGRGGFRGGRVSSESTGVPSAS